MALTAVMIRLAVLAFGHYLEWPDTFGYMQMAERFTRWDWEGYSAQRTPGYPWLIVAAAQNKTAVWVVQLGLGAAIAAMVFYGSMLFTRSVGWSASASIAYLAGPHFLIYESSILSETWFAFLTLGAVLLYIRIARAGQPRLGACLALGFIAGLAVLTRPLQIILLPIVAAGLFMARPNGVEVRPGRRALLFAAPALLMVFLWCGLNRAIFGTFTFSTLSGIALLNVTADFVERADAQYRPMVDVIVPHRDARVRATGSSADVGWLAYRDLKAATGLGDAELSNELVAMSRSAIIAAPFSWLRVVARGWAKFWFAPGGLIRSRTGSQTLGVLAAAPYILLNFCFLAVAAMAIVSRRVRDRLAVAPGLWLIVATVLAASVMQAVTESTSGTRYAVPYQPLYFIVLAAAGSWIAPSARAAVRSEAQWA